MKISKCKVKIKIGDWVRTNGNSCNMDTRFFEGEIGEITDDYFCVWQDNIDGSWGNIKPATKGYKYSWKIWFINPNEIEILKSAETLKIILKEVKKWIKDFKKTQPRKADFDESTLKGSAYFLFLKIKDSLEIGEIN